MIMKRKTILVIEDNEMNMKLVKVLLQKGQFNILEAVDAESGIRLAQEQRPDLILMDVQLPGMDGLTATRIIKEDPVLEGVRVIALTSYAMEGDAKKALEVGCDGYITKPIDTRAFLDTIRKFLEGGWEKNQVSVNDIYPRLIQREGK
jgi:CheY-like chemotaxis protein